MPLFFTILKHSIRNLRLGSVQLLILTCLATVACYMASHFFIERIQTQAQAQQHTLLAAEMVLESRRPLPEPIKNKAALQNLNTSDWLLFYSMIQNAHQEMHFSRIKAIDAHYPLKGQLKIITPDQGVQIITNPLPGINEIWIDKLLALKLKVSLNNTVTLLDQSYTVTHILHSEPDQGNTVFTLAPRALININSLPKAALSNPGARYIHRFLLSGKKDALDKFTQSIQPQLKRYPNISLYTTNNNPRSVNTTLEKGQTFLALSNSIIVLLSVLVILLGSVLFNQSKSQATFVFNALGATKKHLALTYGFTVLWILILAFVFGGIVGFGLHMILLNIFNASLLNISLFNLHTLDYQSSLAAFLTLKPWLISSAMLISLLSFCVLRSVFIPILLLAALLIGTIQNLVLFNVFLACFALVIIISTMAYFISFYIIKKTLGCFTIFHIALTSMQRQGKQLIYFAITLSLLIMLILSLYVVQKDLLTHWQENVAIDLPNQFVINLDPEKIDLFNQTLSHHNIKKSRAYPIIRARLTALNDKSISYHRLLNLTASDTLPYKNTITQGAWFPPHHTQNSISIEKRFAKRIQATLGDTLTFRIGSNTLSGKIVNIREVNWNTFHPNFFIIFPKHVFKARFQQYLLSFHLPKQHDSLLLQLTQRFPSVNFIDIQILLDQAKEVFDLFKQYFTFLVGFIGILSILLLVTILLMTHNQRQAQWRIFHLIGATPKQTLILKWIESITIGLIAGLIGALGANAFGWLAGKWIFDLPFYFNFSILWLAPFISILILMGTFSVLFKLSRPDK